MPEQLIKFWPVAAFALQAFTAWICWSLRGLAKEEVVKVVDAAEARLVAEDKAINVKIADHESRISKTEGLIEEIRSDIEELPTKADLARVEGEVKAVGRVVDQAASGVRRIEDFFIQRGVEA